MRLAILWLMLFLTTGASACPFCRSDTSELVRAGIFNDYFFANLFIAGAPFVLFLVIAALIHFGPWGDVFASLSWNRLFKRDRP